MRIDAHQHFWQYTPHQYGWISQDMGVLRRDFLPVDLSPLLESAGFDGSIAVQARQTHEETEWLLELADASPLIKGVVGWTDLRSPALPEQLERLTQHTALCGVRHVVQDEPDDGFMLQPEFVRGLADLDSFGLTYDLLVLPRQLPVAIKVVAALPGQPFVLDHIAKPQIKDGVIEPWASHIRQLAECSNVYCKVSGMVTEADWDCWSAADLYPYLDVIFEAFGPRRVMFGSDWPVCRLAGTYQQVADVVVGYSQQLSHDEQAAVFGETARHFYGLE